MRSVPLLLVLAALAALGAVSDLGSVRPAPDFPTRDPGFWINSPPLTMSDLRGQVVLVEVWTYG